jgi:uncharacterized membrane protein
MTALILGFFAAAWFGWAQAEPPTSWIPWLTAGMLLSISVAVAGGVLAWLRRSGPSVMHDEEANRRYGIIVGIEFAVAAVGAVLLGRTGLSAYSAPWICLVVGLHFWALAPVLGDPALKLLCILFVAIALAAWLTGWRGEIAASAVTGLGAGLALLTFAVRGLAGAFPTRTAGHTTRRFDRNNQKVESRR